MYILGISAFYHDSAACIIKDGELIACASEERFTRKKGDFNFPINAINFCLKLAGITVDNLDYIGFYDKPSLKFDRILHTYLSSFPRSFPTFIKVIPMWIKEKLLIKKLICDTLDVDPDKILFAEHHISHAASTFLVSPFEKSAILTVDGVGEWATATYGVGEKNNIRILKQINFPDSLGLLYSAFTYYLGFKINSSEYKVMGLAPYGQPKYLSQMNEIIDIREDGSFKLNLNYFAYHYGLRMINGKFEKLFGGPPRTPETKLEQRHFDLAATIQRVTEIAMLKMANNLYEETELENLCLAGGVALNCVANGKILKETPFKNIFVQPAAGDAGGAIGIAYFIYNTLLGNERNFVMTRADYGPEFSDDEIQQYLDSQNAVYEKYERNELLQKVAQLIDEQNVIGWFQGRMEFGPRALGNRSILADARNPKMKDTLNLKIKFRETFRPFAPSVTEDKYQEYFDINIPSPFMLLVAPVREDKRVVPSITHIDGSARLQTVSRETNPLYYDLIKEFERRTGCPVIINTSYNVRGEPIVCTPKDGYKCFMRTRMDYLAIGSFLLDKKKQKNIVEDESWKKIFPPD